MNTLEELKKALISNSLFTPCSLGEAFSQLRFVQADPIRQPARAQDLILRHRVKNYRAGDLERKYEEAGLEECFLYAYGFATSDIWNLIYPKVSKRISDEQKVVLDLISESGSMHPKDLEKLIGKSRKQNAWGGLSRSGKVILDSLQWRGDIRVVRRENGIRTYEQARKNKQTLSEKERFKGILLIVLNSMSIASSKFLISEMSYFKYLVSTLKDRQNCLRELIDEGRVRTVHIDNVEYLLPDQKKKRRTNWDKVMILSPFDPVVRDRTRFESLWNWRYRFEAYTPQAKRILGYYAMPFLWRDQIIGWVNAEVKNRVLHLDFNYINPSPKEKLFKEAAELEAVSMAKFLRLNESSLNLSL